MMVVLTRKTRAGKATRVDAADADTMVVLARKTRAGKATRVDAAEADTSKLSSIRMKKISAIMFAFVVVVGCACVNVELVASCDFAAVRALQKPLGDLVHK
jgi:hypothetical protein